MSNKISKRIEMGDLESAKTDLDSSCSALAAITNAVEVLSSLKESPGELFSHTIPRLMAHANYLATTIDNDMSCFLEKVEEMIAQEVAA